jgi:Leucine-rich repeat (LRR) protein
MIPFFLDTPPQLSTVNLQNNKIEFVTSTLIGENKKVTFADLVKDINVFKKNLLGTTLIIEDFNQSQNSNFEEINDLFNTYSVDFVVKLPYKNTNIIKAKVKSISKFEPNPII